MLLNLMKNAFTVDFFIFFFSFIIIYLFIIRTKRTHKQTNINHLS